MPRRTATTTPARPAAGPHPAAPRAPRAAVHTLGCRLNMAESDHLRRQLEAAGYEVVPWGEPVDVAVVNTCTVTAQADAKSRQAVRAARRGNPQARVAVTGCYAELQATHLAQAGAADLVVGNGEKLNLMAHLDALPTRVTAGNTGADPQPGAAPPVARIVAPRIAREPFTVPGFDPERLGAAPFAPEQLITSEGGTRAHLKIQDGCDFMCTFCVIPTARGRARPRRLDNLRAEGEALAAAGVREVVLTGVNLGTYALEGADLLTVVDTLAALPGIERVRVSSVEPTTVDEGLLERMAEPGHALVPFLHLPLQSGNDAVLAAMRRRYTAAAYVAFAEAALARVPELCLGTDVMAGFPGEDDTAFADTVALLEALPLAYCHVFPYSERSGTPAPRLPGKVPAALRQRRAAMLRSLSNAKRHAYHRRFVGRTLPVLFERSPLSGQAHGYTENFIRVVVPVRDAAALRNSVRPVRLLEAGAERMAGVLETASAPAAADRTPAGQSLKGSTGKALE